MAPPLAPSHRLSAWFATGVGEFLAMPRSQIVGRVAEASGHDITTDQRDAWVAEVEILQRALGDAQGWVFLEFAIPRLGGRVDAVVIVGSAIVTVEFKVGQSHFHRSDINQVWDYALDLKNFHADSHHRLIVPVLVATEAPESEARLSQPADDGVYRPILANSGGLAAIIRHAAALPGIPIHGPTWARSSYRPTPSIVEAAQALYAQHSVEAIARSDAGSQNLAVTSRFVEGVIDSARQHGRKAIAFVTGVPGAGKTLVGLNVATRRSDPTAPTHAVFLSGNDPLVNVLREALARDEVSRAAESGRRIRKGDAMRPVKAFIQNVRHFRDDAVRTDAVPPDHVVIFDEAQRSWSQAKLERFMKARRGVPDFPVSEAAFLMSTLDRHSDWAVVVCLVGGGQEIHDGEAGIAEWLKAVQSRFTDWDVYISPELVDSEYAAGKAIDLLRDRPRVVFEPSLHLATSMRSFRAEHVSRFVKGMLDYDRATAKASLAAILATYPIVLTRDLAAAKAWVRTRARGSERYGLMASSAAYRLKPHAIDVRVNVDPVHYFLGPVDDVRSSFYLEDAATEFQVQGLEVDWACVTWDADLRSTPKGWSHHEFRGSRWNRVRNEQRRQYLENAYRVLLTRARQGMAIFIPAGARTDPTRIPAYYDETFEYLEGLGIPTIT